MFWVKFGLIVITVLLLISITKFIVRKMFKIEKVKKEFFSYNHVNDAHAKIDKVIRIVTSIGVFGFSWVVIFYNEALIDWFLLAVVLFLLVDFGVRAYFEWKHSDQPKQAILTLSEVLIMAAAIFVVSLVGY
ncbi:DUF4181 domain-containing protein [Rossellomorea aquimaris]|uniref:DUF4181 domain-containing protein n=1 Tax=Rossellomorea aquimaris TaxID=189382 RepID=UPI001CD1EE31|nr:DUF4181 domain-containing protein [Rossellomorea aquimaris]MCA1054092.1 DUF4181 domain-containing protein [Rossellomorea aquimaris]